MIQMSHLDKLDDIDQELDHLININRLKSVTYDISPTHTITIYRSSPNKFHLTEIIGELDTFDMNNLKTREDFRSFRTFQQAKPKLTSREINYYSQQSILFNLFSSSIHIHLGYNPGSRNIVYDLTLLNYRPTVSRPPYTQIGNMKQLLEMILEKIYKQGEPSIKRDYYRF